MKIAITVKGTGIGAELEPRFGRANRFLVYETELGSYELFDNTMNAQANSGAGVQTSKRVIDLGATAVITGHVGPKAMAVLEAAGVEVFTMGAETAQDALRIFEAGQIQSGQIQSGESETGKLELASAPATSEPTPLSDE